MIPKIALGMLVSNNPKHVNGALQNLIRTRPFVDEQIIVTDYLSDANLSLLNDLKPTIIIQPINEFPNGHRNAYINKAKELNCDYLISFDTDELPDLLLCSELKSILSQNPQVNQYRVFQKYNISNKHLLDEGELSPYGEYFWKAQIFKLETFYQEPSVIEPVTEKHPRPIEYENWNIVNLPDKYFFTHSKDATDVWFGAVRDFYLYQWSDVGINHEMTNLWNQFIQLTDHMSWNYLNKTLKDGNIHEGLKQFIIDNRNSQFTQLRSLFKYYFVYLHPEENTSNNISQFTPKQESKVDLIVEKAYLDVFHRHPDKSGRDHYTKQVNNGLTKEQLIQILKSSDEYLSNEINSAFLRQFNRVPQLYEFKSWEFLLKNGVVTDIEKTLQALVYPSQASANRIAYCQSCHSGDFDLALTNAVKVKPYVDETILVYDETLTIEQIKKIKEAGITDSFNKWHDNFVEPRNYYLHLARQASCGFVLVSDGDEHFDELFLKNLRSILNQLNTGENQKIGIIRIKPHDKWTDDEEGNLLNEPNITIPKDYWKGLLLRLTPELQYVGVGEMKNVHEDIYTALQQTVLPDEFFYTHEKSHKKDIWPHAVRNFIIGGSGENLGNKNPHWVEFKTLTRTLNINSWYEWNSYFKKGNINRELKEWIIKHKDATCHSWDSELREFYKMYFLTYQHENEL